MTWNFHKTFIQAEVVADRVLPALLVLAIIRKVFHDVFVNSVERKSFLGALSNRQHDESVVRITRFLVGFLSIAFLLLVGDAAGFTIV